ncbi:carboxypeptidase-like regulatory domain-containing protein [Rubrivirga marina]|uniref:Carboxypeptidase regulatory-like domain-containing protein n=1 Tax=Rubrivirga marina TaxID=1196024 RepID=A0A271J639_9BACT|nr:carboxypeptidase-like regulatory domain-containing protein [Rubrivirga marina]PAP78524.1 hypothetical protein BSZ37_19890 [Rubrivirga marina]
MRPALPLLLLLTAAAAAQPGTLAGTVRDARGAPLPGASVYLSGTTRGASADADGRYQLEAVPPGAYRVVASLVGYTADAQEVRLGPGEDRVVDLRLEATTLDLGGVAVEAERDERWQRRLAWFHRTLIGESANADSTRILNPEVLDFRVRWGALRAEAAAPLVIENHALGYRVTYDLSEFSASAVRVQYDGDERFEELPPADSAEAARWEAARVRAYRGSLAHLLQSLLAGTADDAGYAFEVVRTDAYGARPAFRMRADWLMDVGDDGWGTLRGFERIDVTYRGEPEEAAYLESEWFREHRSRPRSVQESSLHLDGRVRIDPQGTPEDPFGISTSGHMAFERLADRVPEEYRPPNEGDAALLRQGHRE